MTNTKEELVKEFAFALLVATVNAEPRLRNQVGGFEMRPQGDGFKVTAKTRKGTFLTDFHSFDFETLNQTCLFYNRSRVGEIGSCGVGGLGAPRPNTSEYMQTTGNVLLKVALGRPWGK